MTRTDKVRERDRLDAVRLQAAGGGGSLRCCAWPGCEAEGVYRAPRSRDRLREFQFLCLDHVREFNQRWNYFAGMRRDEIEAHQRADTTWHRPTWRFGGLPGGDAGGRPWHDAYGLFGDEDGPGGAGRPRTPPPRPLTKAQQMMAVLGIEEGFTLDELKSRYKALAKRHHPDLNGGDKAAEERLKSINEAYTYLRKQHLYA